VTIGIDLSKAIFESIDRTNRSAVLVMPQPHVQSVQLDHETTRLAGLWQTGLWQIVPGNGETDGVALDSASAEAERKVASAGKNPALIQQARDRTEQAIQSLCSKLGWRIAVRWSE
jgi:hypothetical protein